jgi:hypothetical protein
MTELPRPGDCTNCETKAALLKAYQSATVIYSDAVLALNPIAGSTQVHDSLFRLADEAELYVTAARRELEKHIAEHGC